MNSLQIILLVVTLLALLAALAWGFRSYRRSKYSRIKTRLRYQTGDSPEVEEDFRSELPSGGARVVAHRDPDDIETVNSRIREQAEANKPKLSISLRSPLEQAALDLGLDDDQEQENPHIPVLLDPAGEVKTETQSGQQTDLLVDEIEGQAETEEDVPSSAEVSRAETDSIEPEAEAPDPKTTEPDFSDESEPVLEVENREEQEEVDHSILFSEPQTTEKHPYGKSQDSAKPSRSQEKKPAGKKPVVEETSAPDKEPSAHKEPPVKEASLLKEESSEQPDDPILEQQPVQMDSGAEEIVEPETETEADTDAADEEPIAPDEVIIINLMSTAEGEQFRGTDIWAALESQGLEYGNMEIFHFDSGSGADTIKFSAANVLNPGTFPTEKLEYFYTPGICFFMTLTPGVSNLQAFNKLLSAARGVASKLGGELQDQQRNYLTHQSIEAIRTQMGDFQRKHLQG